MFFLPEGPLLGAFFAAVLIIGLTPGPGMMYGVANAISGGTRAAFFAVAGLSLGSLGNCLYAAAGLASLLIVLPNALFTIKFLGALYLVWLAWAVWRTQGSSADQAVGEIAPLQLIRRGAVTNLLNPKSALFYLAFIPQFTDPEKGPVFWQFIVMGLVFNLTGNAINLIVALATGRLVLKIKQNESWAIIRRGATTTIFLAIAAHLVISR